jgi:hypothetical protein
MLARLCLLALLLPLGGCYCMTDRGDATPGSKGYFSGCWAEASKNKGKAD